MGIHWNCLAADTLSRASVPAPVPVPVADLDSDSDSDSDPPRDSILKLVDVDASPVDSAEFSCCFTMVTSCISTWMSISPLSGENNIICALDTSKLIEFTYEELRAATFNFSMNLLLGRGGFGNVYKGWLKEQRLSKGARNRRIAVKRFSGDTPQSYREFMAEISSLGKLSHPNIIKLLGFCLENEEKILVYEYMPKRSLEYQLFSKKPDRVLSWEIRLKIAMEIAEGLAYLHSLERPVIHKDLKPANILLDKSYTAKISDFGLATTAPASSRDHDEYIQEDIICGTYGYIDPFYARNGKLHVKSDVYSFGVVLVELLTGLKLMKNITDGSSTFEEWSEKYLNNRFRLRGIMDSRLEGKYATGQASEIAMLALRCLVSTPKFRPSMKEVAETLEKIKTRAYNRKHLVMCGKCHEAGHYTRSCEKISQVGGNSKLPNASEATTEKKTSSTQSTVLQDSERSEASGVVTETLQITPSSSNLLDASNATKNEKTSAIQSPHPQQGSKRDEANHIGTNKPRNNHPRKTTAVGGNSKALEARNTTKKEKTSSSRLTVQQGNTRKEANGVATSPSCNSTPKTKIPTGATTEEKISTTKSIVRQGKKINETNGAVTSTARSKGPKKINTSMSELPNASNVGRKVRAQSTAQQVNKRNVPTHGGISIK